MTDTAQEQPVKSLNEELADALREAEERDSEEIEEQETEETEEAETDESEEDDGSEDDSEDESEDDSEDDDESDEDTDEEPIEPPQHWAPADRERFEKLPKEAQEFMLDRHKSMEADYTRKTQELASIRKRGEALDEVISPYRQEFQLAGMDDVSAIRQLFTVHDALKRDPTGAVLWLAQQYGADLTQTQDEDVDPKVAALEQRINQMHQEQQRTLTAQQEQQQQALAQQIQTFESEKDEGGNLKHPHFQTVYYDMVRLFQGGIATSLEDAYRKAINLRPDLQQTLQQQQQEQVKKQQKADKAKQAKRAKKAASGVKSSGASVNKDAPSSLRDEIGALVEKQLNG